MLVGRMMLAAAFFVLAVLPGFAEEPKNPDLLPGYGRFELLPIAVSGTPVHPIVLAKFRDALERQVGPTLANWNADGRNSGRGGALGVQVTLTDMRFVTGAKRFWVGPFAGSSHAAGTVALIDIGSGNELAKETFDAASGAWAGTVTVGGLDNRMLSALATRMANYVAGCTSICFGDTDPASAPRPPRSSPDADQAAAPEGDSNPDLYGELMKLDELRAKGILTDEEFQTQKKLILEKHSH